MSELNAFLTIVLGLILRIGIPVAVTAAVITLLRRLDKRWQEQARSVPVVAPGGKPCWEVKGCPEERRKACGAVAQARVPCWQFFRSKKGALREDCLGCDVFLQSPALAPI
jgi:hypothetical protein